MVFADTCGLRRAILFYALTMKVIVDDNIPFIKGRLEKVAEVIYTDQWGFTPALVKDADALIIRTRTRCDRQLLEGSDVRLVATATIGMDQIDTEWCAKAGIKVSNSPGCNAPGVAQYVWAAILRMGFDPARHTLGVVGAGNVGGIVADWGRGLGARVLVNDPPRQELGIADNYASLEEIMQVCDAVTLHTPLTSSGKYPSHHLINDYNLRLMKPGAILVNAARGPVVDFNALRQYVAQGKIRAAIDTWEQEPQTDAEILRDADYATFHIAGYSRQGKERATRMVLEAVEKEFGVEIDKSGLEGPYSGSAGITAQAILDSYNPIEDTMALRQAPEKFDKLRANYKYREEV